MFVIARPTAEAPRRTADSTASARATVGRRFQPWPSDRSSRILSSSLVSFVFSIILSDSPSLSSFRPFVVSSVVFCPMVGGAVPATKL
jgi:hypothetical protein